ncbi:MAG: oligosaccharide flippase family protein [Bacteroidales bacterium]|nr:oligosaccharide flippase family protein [Bacteroidales bacterium]
MSEPISDNRRIAKNTLMLYLRMFVLMLISFYTSRVILQTLGETDFGTYNIVGGTVVLFAIITGALSSGTQRHLSYELGKEDGNVPKVFSACLKVHIWFALLIIVLSELIGVWFVNTQLNLPFERMEAANWVFQFSILSCAIGIIRVPYSASIVAHERMSFYAVQGILEGVFKLVIVFCLLLADFDKLIFYSFLHFAVMVAITILNIAYCKYSFKNIRIVKVKDRQLYKKIISFSNWTIFGSIANVARSQGINIILNIFYGVAINAALGIASQITGATNQFVSGFQQAFNPQLTKLEASKDKQTQTNLICRTAKFSYLILLFVATPILLNLKFILTFWLDKYPLHTEGLCFWIITATLIDALSGPLWMSIFATGKIKIYQIVISAVILLNLPFTYVCGIWKWNPEYAFALQAVVNALAVVARLIFLKKLIGFHIGIFVKKVILPISVVTAVLAGIIFLSKQIWPTTDGFDTFAINSSALLISETIVILYLGLSKQERSTIISKISTKFKK